MINPIDIVVNTLNEALKGDPEALTDLLNFNVPCNQSLANHPTVQVYDIGNNQYAVSVLGLLNGVVEVLTGERIAAIYDEEEKLISFTKHIPDKNS